MLVCNNGIELFLTKKQDI